MKINCIVCDEQVPGWPVEYLDDYSETYPLGGTVFRAYGNYGSTIFDPMDGSFIEIVICDSCLKRKFDSAYHGIDKQYTQDILQRRIEINNLINGLILDDLG
jgi:hypothetical protein